MSKKITTITTTAAAPAAAKDDSFAALVKANSKALLAAASKAAGYRDALRGIMDTLAAHGLAHGMKRAECGKVLAEVLGLKSLIDNKDVSNAWGYACRTLGFEGQKKAPAGKVETGAAENLNSDSGELPGKAVGAAVTIAKDASAADVVSAFHKWVKHNKAAGREALEMIATWQEMTATATALAKAA